MKTKFFTPLLSLTLSVALAACGGGASQTNTIENSEPEPVATEKHKARESVGKNVDDTSLTPGASMEVKGERLDIINVTNVNQSYATPEQRRIRLLNALSTTRRMSASRAVASGQGSATSSITNFSDLPDIQGFPLTDLSPVTTFSSTMRGNGSSGSGRCKYPWQRAADGSRCGKRAASERPGGH